MDNKNKSALSTRWAQMSKQEQIIERKKMEIQAKLEAQKQAAALAAQAKLTNLGSKDDKNPSNIFSNDGSFMSQYKALLEKQKQEKEEKERQTKQEEAKEMAPSMLEGYSEHQQREDQREYSNHDHNERRRSGDKGNRDRRRWNDRGKNRTNSPMDDRNNSEKIPPLMQMPLLPPNDQSPNHENWQGNGDPNGGSDPEQGMGYPDSNMGHGPMMRPGPNMGPGPRGPGPNMGPGPTGPGPNMGAGPRGPGPIMGPGPRGPGQNMGMGPGMNMGSGPMMGPGGPNMPPMPPVGPMPPGGPMPPFMGGPHNYPMPPNWGPNGPGGPCGPGPMPPNMCGPGPNGPMPPFFGPPFPNPSMMRPNGPPNSMMPPNSMNNGNVPFMGRPPFGPNGPNFNNGNGPPNMPFMPPNSMPPMMPPNSMPPSSMGPNSMGPNSMGPNNMGPNSMGPSNMPPNSMPLHNIPEPKPLDSMPEQMNLQNIPLPPPLLSHIPSPKDMESSAAPTNQVSSADSMPPSVQRAAMEVARNGDHWENVLKAIHSQDQNMWFLHNTNSNEYKAFRELVNKMRLDNPEKKLEVKPEDVYEPEFCLDDDYDSDEDSKTADKKFSFGDQDSQKPWNQFNIDSNSSMKREEASSQSDEESESKRERRKRKKSRWGDEPPVADIKPPGVVAPLPPGVVAPLPPGMPPLPPLPGMKLPKIEEDGLKLTNVNRSNPALMQYAMTNYGTVNLSPEDWKKCEDNFKLNLLFQDMLKKRQEVERLAASGKHKYEYDSDEDTAEGTWEHKLRAREMYATEKWADELTKQAAGKHHIGDFLPPEELKKFMEKYSAVKSGKEPDLSDYKEFKLKEDNVGFKMLQKLGWSEGQGLGVEGTGIVDPINKSNQPVANMGLGASSSDVVSPDDDEFDAYRKRMMLAYRFRPNPLNNPRRPYY